MQKQVTNIHVKNLSHDICLYLWLVKLSYNKIYIFRTHVCHHMYNKHRKLGRNILKTSITLA
jgi:hypothetical protein